MKQLIYILLLLSACWACNEEPNFPDPGLDVTKDVRDTVRRDTIDVYQLSMRVKAPNGVERIQVLDGRNYREIASFSEEYAGQTDFIFTYDADISEMTRDTTLHFVVKVIDRNMRSYNKGFSLVIYEFSRPIITLAGVTADGRLTLPNNYIMFKARFKTGMRTIKAYKLSLNGKVFDHQVYDTLMHEYVHKEGYVLEDMTEKNQDYTLTVEMTDSEGEKAVKDVTVRMMDMQHPVKVKLLQDKSGKMLCDREYDYFYNQDKPDRLDKIVGKRYTYNMNGALTGTYDFVTSFTYNQVDMVTKFGTKWAKPGFGRVDFYHEISYDETGLKVTEWNLTENGSLKGIWTVTGYLEDGRIASFTRDESVIPFSWNYEDGLFAEFNLKATNEEDRQMCVGVTSWAMPTFVSGLPPIEISNPSFNCDILELMMYKNGFEKVESQHELVHLYTYVADSKGRLQSMRRIKETSGVQKIVNEYVFEYND